MHPRDDFDSHIRDLKAENEKLKATLADRPDQSDMDAAIFRVHLLQAELDKHRWIPVCERLPEKQGNYLVINSNVPMFFRWFGKTEQWGITSVTHWKPLLLPQSDPKPRKRVEPTVSPAKT